MSIEDYKQLQPKPRLFPAKVKLTAYSGSEIPVVDKGTVNAHNKRKSLQIAVHSF
jgi:hypothetical protein